MYQLELYMKGERDYALIAGPTGPLVYVSHLIHTSNHLLIITLHRYPAGHLYIHKALYFLTNSGTNIAAAQQIFSALYLLSLALTCAIYYQAGGVPNWVLLLLPLSKRLHSIYVLRLFNDCWSVVAAQAAVLSFAGGWNTVGILLYRYVFSFRSCSIIER